MQRKWVENMAVVDILVGRKIASAKIIHKWERERERVDNGVDEEWKVEKWKSGGDVDAAPVNYCIKI